MKQNKSRKEIAEELQDQRGELDTDIKKIQSLVDNCHDDQLEDLQKQMIELLTLREELYPRDKEEDELMENDGNDGAENVNSYYTMNDESSSDSKNSDEYIEEETSQPMIIQEEHKIQVRFDNKILGKIVAKGNNKLWVDTINTKISRRRSMSKI